MCYAFAMKNDKSIDSSLHNELFRNEEEGHFHTSYAQEKIILECVKRGDLEGLERLYRSLPATVYGKMTSSNSELKLLFYACISNTTLVTRYAIEGGLDEETAFSLSDVYIRKMEMCETPDEITSLNEEMAADFTSRVAAVRSMGALRYSLPIAKAIEIIHKNHLRNVSLDSIAKEVGLTSNYFSSLFKKETGDNFSKYVTKVMVEEAKNLLTYSDYSYSTISEYLNFSSQSYFISVFKRYTGQTPKEYREENKRSNW